MSEPASFETRYYLGDASWFARLRRDLRILASSAAFLWLWLTVGRRVRRAVREAERDGRTVFLEDLFGADARR